MPATNPISAIDDVVRAAFTESTLLTALVPVDSMQFYDRHVDVRGDIEEEGHTLGRRLWVKPIDSGDLWTWSSGSALFKLVWLIGYGSASLDLDVSRQIQWQVLLALARLYRLLRADGATPLGDIGSAPLVLQSFLPGVVARPREPWEEAPEWQFETTLTATVLLPAVMGVGS